MTPRPHSAGRRTERPILFSGPMVRAILNGSKTQTRRVMTMWSREGLGRKPVVVNPAYVERWKNEPIAAWQSECPYGTPGDTLWVRETWATQHAFDQVKPSEIRSIDAVRFHYAASEDRGGLMWRPSIHMPRLACRLRLEITDVRFERLQEISCADVDAEGIEDVGATNEDYIGEYRRLWDSLNAKRGYGWDVNPWVWVLSFKSLAHPRSGGMRPTSENSVTRAPAND